MTTSSSARVILIVDSVLAGNLAAAYEKLYRTHLGTIPEVELVFAPYRVDAFSIVSADSGEISLVIMGGLVSLAEGSAKRGTASFVQMLRSEQVGLTCPIIAHTSDIDQRNALMQPGLCNTYVDKGAGFEWPQLVRAVQDLLA